MAYCGMNGSVVGDFSLVERDEEFCFNKENRGDKGFKLCLSVYFGGLL